MECMVAGHGAVRSGGVGPAAVERHHHKRGSRECLFVMNLKSRCKSYAYGVSVSALILSAVPPICLFLRVAVTFNYYFSGHIVAPLFSRRKWCQIGARRCRRRAV